MSMTFPFQWPFDPALAIDFAISYFIHSTVLFIVVWSISRFRLFSAPGYQQVLWKAALLGGIITASCQLILPDHLSGFEFNIIRNSSPIPVLPSLPVEPGMKIFDTEVVPAVEPKGEESNSPVPIDLQVIIVLFLTLWFAVTLFLIAREWAWHIRFLRSIRPRLALESGFPARVLWEMVQSSRLSTSPKITYSQKLRTPVVIGGREICLPERVFSLNRDDQRSLIAHELAHIYRMDYYWQLMVQFVRHFFFFQPLNKFIAERIESNTELMCDAWALKQNVSQISLANSLLEVAGWIKEKPRYNLAHGLALRNKSLRIRITQLLNTKNMKTQLPYFPILFAGLILAFSIIAWSSPIIHLRGSKHDEGAGKNHLALMTRPLSPISSIQDTVPKIKSSSAKLNKKRVQLEEKMEKLEAERALIEGKIHEELEKQQNGVDHVRERMKAEQMELQELQRALEREQRALEMESRDLEEKERAMEEKSRAIENKAREMERVMRQVEIEIHENAEVIEKQAMEMETETRKLEEQMLALELEMESMERAMEENLSHFEAELKELLVSDGIIKNPTDFKSLEWENDTIKINGSPIREELQAKYKSLLDKYFDLEDSFRYHK